MKSDRTTGATKIPRSSLIDADLATQLARRSPSALASRLALNVPFYRLAQLQEALAESEPYRRFAHVTRGYHRFLLEYFFQRGTRAGTVISGKSTGAGVPRSPRGMARPWPTTESHECRGSLANHQITR